MKLRMLLGLITLLALALPLRADTVPWLTAHASFSYSEHVAYWAELDVQPHNYSYTASFSSLPGEDYGKVGSLTWGPYGDGASMKIAMSGSASPGYGIEYCSFSGGGTVDVTIPVYYWFDARYWGLSGPMNASFAGNQASLDYDFYSHEYSGNLPYLGSYRVGGYLDPGRYYFHIDASGWKDGKYWVIGSGVAGLHIMPAEYAPSGWPDRPDVIIVPWPPAVLLGAGMLSMLGASRLLLTMRRPSKTHEVI